MVLLRDDTAEFRQAVLRAAETLGIPEQVVEKDYWITQILRAIRGRYFGQFIMKGGTSLSKGYGLIQRFSEDVDLLLIPQSGGGDTTRVDDLMSGIEDAVELTTGLGTSRETAEEGVATITRAPYRATVFEYGEAFGPEVRIDHGVPGGPLPNESRELSTLLGDGLLAAGVEIAGLQDLTAFSVYMLHPARTLVEKLCVVSTIGRRIDAGNNAVRSREARHFYDIWCLLDEERSPALHHLRERDTAADIFDDCAQITERFYGTVPERPDGGFAQCVVFTEAVVEKLRKSYDKMCQALIFPGAPHPSIDDVVERVQSHAVDL